MKMILTAVVAAFLILPVRAEEKPAAAAKGGWASFFKDLKDKLAQSAVSGERKKGRGAVAAVRGKKQKDMADPNEPTIKGDSKSAKAQKEMALDAEFETSVDQLAKGELEKGLKGLQAFKTAHPKHRVEDVDKAIDGAKAMIAEKAAAPSAPATSEAATAQ
ncbi:MAG: hypothetical protein HYZ74_06175 [Elusimicrobia bacterium]|nr:hypothetical protein [Elusimicrobiota bacterium]